MTRQRPGHGLSIRAVGIQASGTGKTIELEVGARVKDLWCFTTILAAKSDIDAFARDLDEFGKTLTGQPEFRSDGQRPCFRMSVSRADDLGHLRVHLELRQNADLPDEPLYFWFGTLPQALIDFAKALTWLKPNDDIARLHWQPYWRGQVPSRGQTKHPNNQS